MLVRIVIIAALIATTLAVVQKKQVLQNAGLTGYCTTIATPAGQSGFWHECRPGKLTGTPELSLASCKRAGAIGQTERWRCPTALEPNTARQ
jgi:hypothetical protein